MTGLLVSALGAAVIIQGILIKSGRFRGLVELGLARSTGVFRRFMFAHVPGGVSAILLGVLITLVDESPSLARANDAWIWVAFLAWLGSLLWLLLTAAGVLPSWSEPTWVRDARRSPPGAGHQ